jgi:hypothetical protein
MEASRARWFGAGWKDDGERGDQLAGDVKALTAILATPRKITIFPAVGALITDDQSIVARTPKSVTAPADAK